MQDYAHLISALVHDLRTPLTSIVGAASSLQNYADRFDTDTRHKLLQGIVEEADHLDRLLANLSILAKARSGALAPDKRPARVSELLNAVVTKALERREAADITISADGVESELSVDTSLVQGALLNLIELSARFGSDPFKTKLSASADGATASLTIASPIAGERLARLGALLAASDNAGEAEWTRASEFILLEAAREVVQIHGGWLSLHAADGAGHLDVVVTLPI